MLMCLNSSLTTSLFLFYFCKFFQRNPSLCSHEEFGSVATINANSWCQKMAPMVVKNQLLHFKNVFVLSYSFRIHFCNVILFILHVLLQGFEGTQLAIMDTGQLCFDQNVFLIISFFFFSTHSCEKSMICKFLEVWRRWSTCLLI